MTEFLPTVMDDAAAKQLREQKKMQLLEQRIRDAAKAQLAGAKGACVLVCVLVCERGAGTCVMMMKRYCSRADLRRHA